MSAHNDKIIQSTNSIETYAYRTNDEEINKKAESKCSNIIKQYKNY